MKTQTINLKFSLAKTRALSPYLEKQGKTIEGELLDHIDEMYDAEVPEVVREFVASQNPEDSQTESTTAKSHEKTQRQTGRKKLTEVESQTETGPVLVM